MKTPHQTPLLWRLQSLRRVLTGSLAVLFALVLAACSGSDPSQNFRCVIASNDGANGFRTDQVSNCRVDAATGNATFRVNQKQRSRSYVSMRPLTPQDKGVANYWLSRVDQLAVPARTNPAGFDARRFLQEASKATSGFVLVRRKGSGAQAINIVYITNGVYRSIDFSGTNMREVPSGFLTTGL